VREQIERRAARPVQRVEQQHDRIVERRDAQPLEERVAQQGALVLGVGARRRRQIGHALEQLGHEPRELARVRTEARRQIVDAAHPMAERLVERVVRARGILLSAGVDDRPSERVDLAAQLRNEPRLPDAGVAANRDELRLAIRGVVIGVAQHVERRAAPRPRELAARAQRRRRAETRSGAARRLPHDLDVIARRRALSQRFAAADQREHGPRRQDLAAASGSAGRVRLVDGPAHAVAVLPHDLAACEAYAHFERRLAARAPVPPIGRLLHVDGGAGCGRNALERGEDAVAEPLLHPPAVAGDDRP